MSLNVLVVDDNANMRALLRADLEKLGHAVQEAGNGVEALSLLERRQFDTVITDLRMPEMDGMTLLSKARPLYPDTLFVMISAHGAITDAVEAMKRGAADFLTKPFDFSEIERVITKVEGAVDLREEPSLFPASATRGLVGKSRLMDEVRSLIERVAQSDASVLILGESGTGKELVARAIHAEGGRRNGPFVAVNCAAFAEGVLESELFGHEKGAFTGASSARAGRFELADKGTLFLDETGELSPQAQVKLLRVLQERKFERVGGVREIKSDFRLIAATHRDLEADVKAGRFREDLFYRINVVPVQLPPLRERKEDIPLLAAYFLKTLKERMKTPVQGFTDAAMNALSVYAFPGNIRELENLVERTLVLCQKPLIDAADWPPHITARPFSPAVAMDGGAPADLKEAVKGTRAGLEREYIAAALKAENNNRTYAAKRLGISRKGLQLKIKEYGL